MNFTLLMTENDWCMCIWNILVFNQNNRKRKTTESIRPGESARVRCINLQRKSWKSFHSYPKTALFKAIIIVVIFFLFSVNGIPYLLSFNFLFFPFHGMQTIELWGYSQWKTFGWKCGVFPVFRKWTRWS